MELTQLEKQFSKTEDLAGKLKIAGIIIEIHCLEEKKLAEYYDFIARNAFLKEFESNRYKALAWLGNYHYRHSRFDTALYHLYEVTESYETHKDTALWASCMNNIAVVYTALGQREKSIAIYEEILKTNHYDVNVLKNYSDMLLSLGKVDDALKYMDQAMQAAEEKGDLAVYYDMLSSYPHIYNQINQYQKTIEIYDKYSEYITKYCGDRTVLFLYLNYSQALMVFKKENEAIEFMEKALKIAEDNNIDEYLYFCYIGAIDAYQTLGNHEKQIEYLNKLMALKDKLYSFQIREKIEELESRTKKEKMMSKTRELIDKAKHLASIGIMASGITHEINQPLNAIMIEAQTILYKDDQEHILPESYRNRIVYIIEATERISNIIKHIRSYWIRNDWVEKKEFEVNHSISKAMDLISQQIKAHGIYLKLHLLPYSVYLFGTPVSLEQILINLIINSLHALDTVSEKKKTISITCTLRENLLYLHVEDNGPGIKEDIADKIFEPFFTQKDPLIGSGLGLTLVQNFLKDLNGTIELIKEKKKGAHFLLKIPISHKQTKVKNENTAH